LNFENKGGKMNHTLDNSPTFHSLGEQHKQDELFQEYLDKAIAETLALAKKIQGCRICNLQGLCNKPLPGAGYPLADVLLLKEIPTALEDAEKVAFFGEIGEVLKNGFDKLDLDITDVYGTNTVKCSAPLKKITETHIRACKEHLKMEIKILQPKIILAMGKISIMALDRIMSFKDKSCFQPGKVTRWGENIIVITTHDPQKALKEPALKREFWAALKTLKRLWQK